MEETAAANAANTDLPSSTPWPEGATTTITPSTSTTTTTTTLIVAVAVGMVGVVVMVLWRCWGWRWGQCSRQLVLRRVVRAEKDALYRFLSDPAHLKVIHPYTTEIRMKSEKEEEEEEDEGEEGGGERVTLKEFDWVEKVPFKVVSAARMRCDPRTCTITIDVVPMGSVNEVQLKWWLIADNPDPSDVSEETSQPTNPQDSARSSPATISKMTSSTDAAHDTPVTNGSDSADDQKSAEHVKESRSTEFHNQIRVTGPGPCLIVVYIMLKIVERIEVALMGRLQQYFEDRSE